MKKMKWAVLFAALVSVFGFSSCLDSGDGGYQYDILEYVTVEDNGMFGTAVLKGDGFGYTYIPVSSSVLAGLKDKNGEYVKRVQVGIKLMEGEAFSEEKKTYKISEIQLYSVIPYKDFNLQSDTLKQQYELVELGKMWAINGYVNVPFTFKTREQLSLNDFHLYATGAIEDTLVTRLHQAKGFDDAYNHAPTMISFRMPTNHPDFYEYFSQLQPKQDSIVVKVTAKGEHDKELVSTVKCSWSNMQGY